jgi:hypothetical protein
VSRDFRGPLIGRARPKPAAVGVTQGTTAVVRHQPGMELEGALNPALELLERRRIDLEGDRSVPHQRSVNGEQRLGVGFLRKP